MSRHELVPVAYRPPFAFGQAPWIDQRPHGQTLLEIVQSVPNLPRPFLAKGVVCINGETVPRELWSYVRPKPTSDELPIAVTLHWSLGSPGGGGGNSTKSIIGLVAAIALIAVTAFLAAPAGLALLGSFGISGFGATLFTAAVGIAGALAISALTAPPTQDVAPNAQVTDSNAENRDPSGASGNIIAPGGSIPRIIGTRKVYPPLVCEPVVELVGNDEWVEALFALNGPHVMDNLAIDGMVVDDDTQGIEAEATTGSTEDAPIGLITRQGRTITPQITLSQHNLSNSVNLPSGDPEEDLPIWHRVITRVDPSEIWIHLLFPGGIFAPSITALVVPFRVRMRRFGDTTWINLPEFHIYGNSSQQTRRAIIFTWDESYPGQETMPTNNGFVYARRSVPPQTVATASPSTWTANGYFDDGAGNEYVYNGNEGSSRIINMSFHENRAKVYLNDGTFPRDTDKYEIEIMRGAAFDSAQLTKTTYSFALPSANVKDFFWYYDTGGNHAIPQSQSGYSMSCLLVRVVSIWNAHPVNAAPEDFALLAIKARNRQLQRVSVDAGGLTRVWNGFDYGDYDVSSNPAWHYRDVLLGDQNLDPLDGGDGVFEGDNELLDEQGILDWADLCDLNGWTCNAIVDDMRTQDVLTLLASCGYAKPYQSDQYGVTVDNDRTADAPIQVFSRINAAGMRFEKAFARVPEGFIVNYRNEAEDDDRAQTIVYQRDPSIATTGLLETISYDGLIEQDQVEARALFDLDQANLRSTFYTLDTDIESIVCRRGSLVALQHDILTSRAGDAHIVSKTVGSSPAEISGFVLDAEIHVTSGANMHAVTDMHLVTDMHDVGITTGIAIRHTDGTISTHLLSGVTGDTATITLAVPIAATSTIVGYDDTNHEYGSMIVSGNLGSEYIRLLVLSITPTNDLKAKLVLVDEAPDLERFGA